MINERFHNISIVGGLLGLSLLVLVSMPSSVYAACETPNLLIVLDRSGSMGGSKWTYATSAIRTITNNYNGKLRFGLESFASSASIDYGLTSCIRDGSRCVANLQSALSRLRASGGTNLIAALNTAKSHLTTVISQDPVKGRKNSIMFITDGQASCADAQAAGLLAMGVQTYIIGFGTGVSATCLNNMATKGGTALSGSRKYYQANSSSELNKAMTAIANAASAETCNNVDDDCDGRVDEGLTRSCTGQCGPGTETCSRGVWGPCSSASPQPETCNNKDDDCDGRTDEGLRRPCKTACGSGTQTCSAGRWVNCTAPKPKTEVCDGKDNDCDGKTDENWTNLGQNCSVGIGECQRTGKWRCRSNGAGVECSAKAGAPSTETCDGKDNDCDGSTDEDWSKLGQSCTSGTGACKQTGKYICKPDGSGVQCSVTGSNPTAEKCDGQDNDCDGKIDEGLTQACKTICGTGLETCKAGKWEGCTARKPTKETCNGKDDDCDGDVDEGLTRECSTKCGKGTEKCVNGNWDFCDAQKPEPEVCDGKDNDCNGKADDGIPPKKCQGPCGEGTAVCERGKWSGCSGPEPKPEKCDGLDNDCDGKIDEELKRACSTACGSGEEVCTGGQWTACSAPKPEKEICDGKDNDCNGKIDDGATCPPGRVCKEGACRPLCDNGECPKGMTCVDGTCMGGDPCAGVHCPSGEECVSGQCIKKPTKDCSTIKCQPGYVCQKGQCVKEDCYVKPCPSGERCVNGKCEADPCKDKKCADGEFCRDGKCVGSCAEVKCKSDEKCVDGECKKLTPKEKACAGVNCPAGEICKEGKCVGDPCKDVTCPDGRRCVEGVCEHDPCVNVQCPAGQACYNGQCLKPEDVPGPKEANDKENPADTKKDPKNEEYIQSGKDGGEGKDDDTTGTAGKPGCLCGPVSGAPLGGSAALLLLFLLLGVSFRQRR